MDLSQFMIPHTVQTTLGIEGGPTSWMGQNNYREFHPSPKIIIKMHTS